MASWRVYCGWFPWNSVFHGWGDAEIAVCVDKTSPTSGGDCGIGSIAQCHTEEHRQDAIFSMLVHQMCQDCHAIRMILHEWTEVR